MVKINDNYGITVDSLNYILVKTATYKEGKHKGEEYTKVLGYYNTLADALMGYIEIEQKGYIESGDSTIAQAVKDLECITDSAVNALKACYGRFNDLPRELLG